MVFYVYFLGCSIPGIRTVFGLCGESDAQTVDITTYSGRSLLVSDTSGMLRIPVPYSWTKDNAYHTTEMAAGLSCNSLSRSLFPTAGIHYLSLDCLPL